MYVGRLAGRIFHDLTMLEWRQPFVRCWHLGTQVDYENDIFSSSLPCSCSCRCCRRLRVQRLVGEVISMSCFTLIKYFFLEKDRGSSTWRGSGSSLLIAKITQFLCRYLPCRLQPLLGHIENRVAGVLGIGEGGGIWLLPSSYWSMASFSQAPLSAIRDNSKPWLCAMRCDAMRVSCECWNENNIQEPMWVVYAVRKKTIRFRRGHYSSHIGNYRHLRQQAHLQWWSSVNTPHGLPFQTCSRPQHNGC